MRPNGHTNTRPIPGFRSAEYSRKEIMMVDPTGKPLDVDTLVVQKLPNSSLLEYFTFYQLLLILA